MGHISLRVTCPRSEQPLARHKYVISHVGGMYDSLYPSIGKGLALSYSLGSAPFPARHNGSYIPLMRDITYTTGLHNIIRDVY